MVMDRRRKSDAKWYQQSPIKDWDLNMIPNLSRPSSRKSGNQSSLQEADWVSLGGARSLSGSSSVFESPRISYFGKRRQSRGDIEEILAKHQLARPRSVSLVKYDPLPAINSDMARTQMISKTPPFATELRMLRVVDEPPFESKQKLSEDSQISPIQEHDGEVDDLPHDSHEDEADNTAAEELTNLETEEEEADSSSPQKDGPPKLVRSRTFDVIKTNLTNLPVIDYPSNMSESEHTHDESETRSSQSSDVSETDQSADSKPKFEVCVSVNGVALNTFLSQSEEDSPLSPLSMVTHPGTPDSGFVVGSGISDQDPNFEGSHEDGSDFSDSETTDNTSTAAVNPIENRILVKLPDDSDVNLKFNFDVSLKDFLTTLETLEWEEQRIRVIDEVDDEFLDEPLRKFPFKSDTEVCLVPSM